MRHGLAGLLERPYFDDVIQDAASTYGVAARERHALVRERLLELAARGG